MPGAERERATGRRRRLNDEQTRAVRAPIGPTVVAAGPGSGKTLVTTRRVVWMIRDMDIDPETIVAFTFTNRAARELRRRIRGSLTQDEADSLFVGTFHTWGANFLKTWGDLGGIEPDFTIYDVDDSLEAVEAGHGSSRRRGRRTCRGRAAAPQAHRELENQGRRAGDLDPAVAIHHPGGPGAATRQAHPGLPRVQPHPAAVERSRLRGPDSGPAANPHGQPGRAG